MSNGTREYTLLRNLQLFNYLELRKTSFAMGGTT